MVDGKLGKKAFRKFISIFLTLAVIFFARDIYTAIDLDYWDSFTLGDLFEIISLNFEFFEDGWAVTTLKTPMFVVCLVLIIVALFVEK